MLFSFGVSGPFGKFLRPFGKVQSIRNLHHCVKDIIIIKKIYNILGTKHFFVEKGGPRFFGEKNPAPRDWSDPKEFGIIYQYIVLDLTIAW